MAKSAGRKTTTKKSTGSEIKYLCPYCNKEKSRTEFYMSTDPLVLTGITTMCKDCAEKIARNWNEVTREYGDCTKFSIQAALERLDKPWFEDLYNSSVAEVNNPKSEHRKSNVWAAYIKNVSMQQHRAKRWRDGDMFAVYKEGTEGNPAPVEEQASSSIFKGQEILEEYKKNFSKFFEKPPEVVE